MLKGGIIMHILFTIISIACLIELILLLIKPKWATLGRELPNKKKSIKNLILVMIVFFILSGFTDKKNSISTNTATNKIQSVENNDKFLITSQPNTSEAVDELILKGKNDSKNVTEDDIKEAIKFINNNYNKYWVDNETMQRTLYYGALLEYSSENKDIKELGLDSVQVIKYVYRGLEKIEDESTQSNLEQIKKSLDKIPDEYKK